MPTVNHKLTIAQPPTATLNPPEPSPRSELLAKVVRLPMSFFDSQPTGRLLNRFTKDTEAVDVTMSGTVSSALTCFVSAGLSLAVVIYVSPLVILAVIPLMLFYHRVQKVRARRRPLCAGVSCCLCGAHSILLLFEVYPPASSLVPRCTPTPTPTQTVLLTTPFSRCLLCP